MFKKISPFWTAITIIFLINTYVMYSLIFVISKSTNSNFSCSLEKNTSYNFTTSTEELPDMAGGC